MKKFFLYGTRLPYGMAVAVALLLAAPSHAAPRSSEKQDAGLEEKGKQADLAFSKWDAAAPGCSLSVMQDGKIIYERGYGMADLDHDVVLKPDSVFHVASMSKQFTAAAIMLLVLDGKISLDDDIHKYLPKLPDFGEKITVAQLIHHTSGIRDQWELLGLAGWRYSLDLITDEDVMSLVYRQKELNFKPGDRFLYDNTGYTLLGQIVQKVSGQSLREFTTTHIFTPLGMSSTHFRDDHAEVVKRDAYGYMPTGKPNVYRLSITNFDTVGATGLLTTVEDLAKWDENFYNPKVGGPEFLKLMLKAGALNNGKPTGGGSAVYASGLELGSYRGLPIVEHSGADAGYRADLVRFPRQHFSVATLCNRADAVPSDKARRVADVFLANDFTEPAPHKSEVKAVDVPEKTLAEYVGLYWNRETQRPFRLAVREGKLTIVHPDGSFAGLVALGPAKFLSRIASNTYDFSRTSSGGSWHLTIMHEGSSIGEFTQEESYHPSSADLNVFAGTYASEEIDPKFQITAGKDGLTLTRFKSDPQHFLPTIKDSFEDEDGVNIHFQRDAKGQVTEFFWDSGRITNFRFRKVDASKSN